MSKAPVAGVIDRNRVYTTRAVLRECGLGEEAMRQARLDGVKPRKAGRWYFYDGNELADWVLNRPTKD